MSLLGGSTLPTIKARRGGDVARSDAMSGGGTCVHSAIEGFHPHKNSDTGCRGSDVTVSAGGHTYVLYFLRNTIPTTLSDRKIATRRWELMALG